MMDEQMRRRLHVLEQDVAAVQRKLDSEFVACGYPVPDQRRATGWRSSTPASCGLRWRWRVCALVSARAASPGG